MAGVRNAPRPPAAHPRHTSAVQADLPDTGDDQNRIALSTALLGVGALLAAITATGLIVVAQGRHREARGRRRAK